MGMSSSSMRGETGDCECRVFMIGRVIHTEEKSAQIAGEEEQMRKTLIYNKTDNIFSARHVCVCGPCFDMIFLNSVWSSLVSHEIILSDECINLEHSVPLVKLTTDKQMRNVRLEGTLSGARNNHRQNAWGQHTTLWWVAARAFIRVKDTFHL